MNKNILGKKGIFSLFLFTVFNIGAVNAQVIKDKDYYQKHIDEAKAVVHECKTKEYNKEKNPYPAMPDNCQNAKAAVWLYNHTYKPKSN